MNSHKSQARAGYQHGKLFTAMHPDGTTARTLPDLPACAQFIISRGPAFTIRAEHLRGFHVWHGTKERQPEKYDLDLLINLMRLRIGEANKAGIRAAIGEEAATINQQQYLDQP